MFEIRRETENSARSSFYFVYLSFFFFFTPRKINIRHIIQGGIKKKKTNITALLLILVWFFFSPLEKKITIHFHFIFTKLFSAHNNIYTRDESHTGGFIINNGRKKIKHSRATETLLSTAAIVAFQKVVIERVN